MLKSLILAFPDEQQAASPVPTPQNFTSKYFVLYRALTIGTTYCLEFESWSSSQTLPLFLSVPLTTHLTPRCFLLMRLHNEAPQRALLSIQIQPAYLANDSNYPCMVHQDRSYLQHM